MFSTKSSVTQLTLGVSLKDEATFENFFPGKNLQIINELQNCARGFGEKVLYLYGAAGEGRTHLLQACCHTATQHQLRAVYLPLSHLTEFSPSIFDELEMLDLICLDDIHKMAGLAPWEEAFFHLFNRIYDAGKRLIVTAQLPPKSLGFTLPDVTSRLVWGMVFHLQSLSDEDKLSVFIMRAERRGMTVSEEVGKFILNHCPRHMSTLFAALDVLDKVSLAAQRKLTIPFVKTVLQI